ncbi:MAG: dihydropteroate synthase [Alphaproteobacteria bacterium]
MPLSFLSETPAVMGILNVTPDSFSGDGLSQVDSSDMAVEQSLRQAERFLADGADILDIGGESTRPGATPIDAETEWRRIGPVIKAICRDFPGVVLSVDTYKASVARKAVAAGAAIINDVWGGLADPDMLSAMADTGAPAVLMHNRSKPSDTIIDERLGGAYVAPDYENFMDEILVELQDLAASAEAAGIAKEKIILDPGIGFGKTDEQNMMLISQADRLRTLGYPILLGPSRKGFIGRILDVSSTDRLEGTAATIAVATMKGADIVRVHDVRAMKRVVTMTRAIMATGV